MIISQTSFPHTLRCEGLKDKDNLDMVALLYKLLQTDTGIKISDEGKKWVEYSSIDNIANFLSAYIAV